MLNCPVITSYSIHYTKLYEGFLYVAVDLKGYRTGSMNEGGLVSGLPPSLDG